LFVLALVCGHAHADSRGPQGRLRYPGGRAISSGTFGKVWRGVDETGREFAAKEIATGWIADHEARANLAIGDYAGWAKFHWQNQHVLYFDWAEGQKGSAFQPRSEGEAVRAALKLSETLVELHRRNLVHEDVKPGNLIIARVGDDIRVTLLDFGQAAAIGQTWYQETGTPHYRAPEQVGAHTASRTLDTHGAAKSLLYWLTGDSRRQSLGEVKDPALRAVIGQAISQERKYRLLSEELVERLQPFASTP
jgi:serine/threonine protein kinase